MLGKSKRSFNVSYGAITINFGSINAYKKMMHNKKISWITFYYLLQKLTCLFALWKISG
jgi:hypothetical protein